MTSVKIDAEHAMSMMKHVTIFAGINETNIRQIYDNCTIIDTKAGDIIFQEGTPATEIYLILSGKCSVILNLGEDPMEIVEFGPGNCIGESSVIGVQHHCASVLAKEDSVLLELSRKMLMDIFENDKGLFSMLIINIARELARRLHNTNQLLYQYRKMARV